MVRRKPWRNGSFPIHRQQKIMRGDWANENMLAALERLIPKTESVLDVGAGPGHYVHAMLKRGWESVRGVDGTPGIVDISGGHVLEVDVGAPRSLEASRNGWDWVLSLEVGEHIRRRREGFFLQNLARTARKGMVISWSANPRSYGHVNVRSAAYLGQRFWLLGWQVDDDATMEMWRTLGRRFRSQVMVLRPAF